MRFLLTYTKSLLVIGATALIASGLYAANVDAGLDDLEKQYKKTADIQQVEITGLAMLTANPTKEDEGRIYAKIAELAVTNVGQAGNMTKNAISVDKIREYAEKALSCPIDPLTKAKAYLSLGCAANAMMPRYDTAEYSSFRVKAVVPYLRGIKCLLDLGVPEFKPVRMEKIQSPRDAASIAAWDKQAAEYKTAVQLVDMRNMLTTMVLDLYRFPPYNNEELNKLASEIVQDKDVVEKIVNKATSAGNIR